ncbi:MAG: peptide chain release factor N(5)-glutamine methyltransferase [Bacteroidetes bacterium]|nr:peptide chain release factor N(5)-glutamine methyltransferase [Bacteroidota bacterium]
MELHSKYLTRQIVESLTIAETNEGKELIATWLLEYLTGFGRSDLLKDTVVKVDDRHLRTCIDRLNNDEPVQYVLGEAWFYGRKFNVHQGVLIPRPETELIVDEVKAHLSTRQDAPIILDIATGSGCIAISLSLEITGATVHATDISGVAIEQAKLNARSLGAEVSFLIHDIVNDPLPFNRLDVVVSNPPYIRLSERQSMSRNVLAFEPHEALFVPDADPLCFHRSIAVKAQTALLSGGLLITEINEALGSQTADLFEKSGYVQVRIIRDLTSRDRFVAGLKGD